MNNELYQIIDIIDKKIKLYQSNLLFQYQIQTYNEIKNMLIDYKKQNELGIDVSHTYNNIITSLNKIGLDYLIKNKKQEEIIEEEDEEEDEYSLKPKNNKIIVTKSTIEKKTDYIIKWIKALQCDINETETIIRVYNDIKEYLKETYKHLFIYDINEKSNIMKISFSQLREIIQHKTHKKKEWSKYLFNLPYFYCKLTGKVPPKLDPYYLKLLKDISIDFTKYCMNLSVLKTTKRMYMGFIIKKSLEFIQKEYGKNFENFYELIHEQTKETIINNEKTWMTYISEPRFKQFKKEIYEKKLINNEDIEEIKTLDKEEEKKEEQEQEEEFEEDTDIFNEYKP